MNFMSAVASPSSQLLDSMDSCSYIYEHRVATFTSHHDHGDKGLVILDTVSEIANIQAIKKNMWTNFAVPNSQ